MGCNVVQSRNFRGVSTNKTISCMAVYISEFKSRPVFDQMNRRQLLKEPLCIVDIVVQCGILYFSNRFVFSKRGGCLRVRQ
jgi:hypothetical protein